MTGRDRPTFRGWAGAPASQGMWRLRSSANSFFYIVRLCKTYRRSSASARAPRRDAEGAAGRDPRSQLLGAAGCAARPRAEGAARRSSARCHARRRHVQTRSAARPTNIGGPRRSLLVGTALAEPSQEPQRDIGVGNHESGTRSSGRGARHDSCWAALRMFKPGRRPRKHSR